MKKYVVIALVLVLLASVLYFNKNENNRAEKPVITIGATLPLTGNQANIGLQLAKAMKMAISDINSNIDNKYKYKLIIEDDMMDLKKVSLNASKLIVSDDAKVLVSFSSSAGNVISSIARNNKIIHIGTASDSNIRKGDFNYSYWPKPVQEADKMFEEIKKREIKSIAFVSLNHQGYQVILNSILDKLRKENIEIKLVETINPKTRDFKPIISKLVKLSPDIIYLGTFSPDQEIFVKQMREQNLDIPLTTVRSFSLSTQKELFNGNWYIDVSDGNSGFLDRFMKETKSENTFAVGYFYDIINIIYKASESINNYKNVTSKNLSVHINNLLNFEGVSGEISMVGNGLLYSDVVTKVIKNGKPVLLEDE
jgi:branched-chain amino acid transport system substrate-binding protein